MAILRESFRGHIEDVGGALVSDAEEAKNPVKFVSTLLEMRKKYSEVVESCFRGDKEFVRAMKEAFEFFVNVDRRCAQFFSLFLDAEFRVGFRTKGPEEIEESLSSVITAFRFLKDKDVFEVFYKQHLQKRLLTGRSVNSDAERSMILKLKAECGPQYTSKMEGMFSDLRVSRDQMSKYRRDTGSSRDVAIDVTILTTVHWPNISETPCRLPSVVQPVADTFRDWYLSKHTGRRIEWATAQGTAELGMLYTAKRYELVVSTYQMCVLMLFNGAASMTFERIRTETGIPVDQLKRHLLSLTTSAARVLVKKKKGRTIEDDDEFCINDKYKSPKTRNRIKLITLKSALGTSTPVTGGAVPEQVELARRNMMDAAIVRIMKARRTLSHAELVGDTLKLLSVRFTPKPVDIKSRIESLIEREYLARDEEDHRVYSYVA